MATIDELLRQAQTPSRFARLMTPSNILDDMLALRETTRNARRDIDKVKQAPRAPTRVAGQVKGDPQFEAILHFGEQPLTPEHEITEPVYWTEPLIDPELDPTIYYVRVRISQHMVEPLLQGFRIRWTHPPNWRWRDGHGSVTIHEAVSNPLDVVRQAARISDGPSRGFHASVETKYLP